MDEKEVFVILNSRGIRYAIVSIPSSGLGKWGRYARPAELRIRYADDDRPLKGRGCHDGLLACYRVDTRYAGLNSHYGKLLKLWRII